MTRRPADPAWPGLGLLRKFINVHALRKRWGIPTVKINGVAPNPARWPDGSYSVQGAAATLGITPQTVLKWLRKGRLIGRQRIKGQP